MHTPAITVYADLWLTADAYNPRLRATVPGSWVLRLWDRLPGQFLSAPVPEFYGNTPDEAKRNAVQALKGYGVRGVLKVTRCDGDAREAAESAEWEREQRQTLWAEMGGYAAGIPRPCH